ncbi:MAG: 8-amino-7-oxononanoate synthase [Nitrospirae bacterium]|nr:8-amino-7-oxononanoate synthase [Nitrospirota bacterium]
MFEHELSQLDEQHLLRRLRIVDSYSGSRITIHNREMLLLCSNDYLGLANHPSLRQAAVQAMERYGFGAGASRLISGTSRLHQALEDRIARFKGAEAALVFNSGYAANTGIIPAIAGTGDMILSDSLNHASIIDGCRLSKAEVRVYRHKDAGQVETFLKKGRNAGRKLIVTDGVFSMDGDIAPLQDLLTLAEKYDAILMVDDAHGAGVLGETGRGTVEHLGLSGRVHIQMGTLGKAFGSFGAYAAGSKDLINMLINQARSFIYSTALPPSVCAASLAAIDIVEQEPELRDKLWKNRSRFVNGLKSIGISTGNSETPIIPIIIGDPVRALTAAEKLFEYGIYVPAIRPPTVPANAARIRTTVTAAHTGEDIDSALDIFRKLKQEGYL